MGNNRNLTLLVVVLVVLAGLYFLSRNNRSHMDATGGYVDLVEGQLSTDEVFSLTASLGGESLELVKESGDWRVRTHFDAPANLNKLRSLLGALEGVEGEFRSEDASVLPDYALTDSSAYHLVVRRESGDALVDLLVGKRGGSGCFVRRSGSDAVYLADHNFLSDLGVWGEERKPVEAKSWVDLEAYKVDGATVKALELVQGSQVLRLDKEFEATPADSTQAAAPPSYEWRLSGPENFLAVRTKAEAILNSLTALRANDVVARGTAPEGAGLDDGADVVRVLGDDGVLATLQFGSKLDDATAARYFRVEGEDLVWQVPDYISKNIFKSVDDLRPE